MRGHQTLKPSCHGIPTPAVGRSRAGAGWSERLQPEAAPRPNARQYDELARRMMTGRRRKAQKKASAHGVPHAVDRALHAKSTLALDDAELRFRDDLPEDLRDGFAQPGAAYPHDRALLQRRRHRPARLRTGPARRRAAGPRGRADVHDLLMTNFPVSHARNARQFVEFAQATAGRPALAGGRRVARLVRLFGVRARPSGCCSNVSTARATSPAAWRPRRTGAAAPCAGATPSPCATCCGPRRRHPRIASVGDRPGLPLHTRPPGAWPRGQCASSCASSGTRPEVDADRGHRVELDGAVSPAEPWSRCSPSPRPTPPPPRR